VDATERDSSAGDWSFTDHLTGGGSSADRGDPHSSCNASSRARSSFCWRTISSVALEIRCSGVSETRNKPPRDVCMSWISESRERSTTDCWVTEEMCLLNTLSRLVRNAAPSILLFPSSNPLCRSDMRYAAEAGMCDFCLRDLLAMNQTSSSRRKLPSTPLMIAMMNVGALLVLVGPVAGVLFRASEAAAVGSGVGD